MSTPHIPSAEFSFKTARSSGPGGQNVNKVETKVTLLFDLDHSPNLTDQQKEKIRLAMPGRINKEDVLRVTSSKYRSQSANREAATERFYDLIGGALAPRKSRRKTRPSRKAKKKRLESKRKRSEVKRLRRKPNT